ncbi:MAG: GDP-L-fucose synthase, partial [Bacteroidota bacterium]
CYFLMQEFDEPGFLNVGTGVDHSIKTLAHMIAKEVGYGGEIVHDLSKPDGTPRKLMDVSKLANLGWRARIDLRTGIKQVYAGLTNQDWF